MVVLLWLCCVVVFAVCVYAEMRVDGVHEVHQQSAATGLPRSAVLALYVDAYRLMACQLSTFSLYHLNPLAITAASSSGSRYARECCRAARVMIDCNTPLLFGAAVLVAVGTLPLPQLLVSLTVRESCACACESASATSRVMRSASSTGSGPSRSSRSRSDVPSTSGIT